MIVMKAGIRTLSGITLRSNEITALEPISTSVAAAPIPRPLKACVVTANVGQVPNTRRSTGFSLIKPAVRISP